MNHEGRATYASSDGTYVLRLQGALRHTLGHALEAFIDRVFARSDFKNLVIDLGDAESIDSTILGLLAKVANLQRKRGGDKPLLYSPRADINAVFASICLDDFFAACTDVQSAATSDIPATEPAPADRARTVLDAHLRLSEMNEHNRAIFQDVVDAFRNDPTHG